MIYSLILTDLELSYENHSEDFFIAIFATRQQAEETACYYLANLPGFCDYPCTYRIEKKEVVDNSDNAILFQSGSCRGGMLMIILTRLTFLKANVF